MRMRLGHSVESELRYAEGRWELAKNQIAMLTKTTKSVHRGEQITFSRI